MNFNLKIYNLQDDLIIYDSLNISFNRIDHQRTFLIECPKSAEKEYTNVKSLNSLTKKVERYAVQKLKRKTHEETRSFWLYPTIFEHAKEI